MVNPQGMPHTQPYREALNRPRTPVCSLSYEPTHTIAPPTKSMLLRALHANKNLLYIELYIQVRTYVHDESFEGI